jgi:hypothetical protein
MFNHDVCLCTSNGVHYFRLNINQMTEFEYVLLFLNLAWTLTVNLAKISLAKISLAKISLAL